jgi:hypothetical protein
VTIRATLALTAVLACGLPIACGGDDEGRGIPQDSASVLQRQLNSIQSRLEAGDAACRDVVEGDDTNLAAVRRTINSLPDDVNQDVRDALRDSFDRLFELVEAECEPQPETTPTETTPPPTIETEPETETQPQTETAPPPEKPKKEEKRDDDGGGGQEAPGNGGGGAIAPEGD